ncbi:MAG: LppX_LprAFG lipoprotein [Marmoricola sp.]
MRNPARPLLAAVLGLALLAGGCGGSQGPDVAPHRAMTRAAHLLEHTPSVHLTLSTDGKPRGNGIIGAGGTLSGPSATPAFRGRVRVSIGGLDANVPVVSVDGKVHARLPMSTGWAVIDPHQYGAPDPADFITARGLPRLLTELSHLKSEGSTRDGRLVLAGYSGTLSGRLVEGLLPGASPDASYPVRLGVDPGGRLRTVTVTGRFFSGSGSLGYHLALDHYGKHVTITAP